MKIIILKGLPASGKSTWAIEYIKVHSNTKRVNKDDLRAMIDVGVWSGDHERYILNIRDMLIKSFLKDGFDVIVDDTNLSPKRERRLRSIVPSQTEVVIIDEFLDVSLEECIKRDAERVNPVGQKVIQGMYTQFISEQPRTKQEKSDLWYKLNKDKKEVSIIPHNADLEDCWIFDIDGTVAKHVNRSPFDYTKVLDDLPYRDVLDILDYLSDLSKVFFVSGREESDQCRKDTIQWLNERVWEYEGLYMRPEGDYRKDVLIKQEIYKNHFEGKYNVLGWFDDRSQVVKGIRELGIRVYQVADGNF